MNEQQHASQGAFYIIVSQLEKAGIDTAMFKEKIVKALSQSGRKIRRKLRLIPRIY